MRPKGEKKIGFNEKIGVICVSKDNFWGALFRKNGVNIFGSNGVNIFGQIQDSHLCLEMAAESMTAPPGCVARGSGWLGSPSPSLVGVASPVLLSDTRYDISQSDTRPGPSHYQPVSSLGCSCCETRCGCWRCC